MLIMDTLYLTKGELKFWQKLPARLKKVWGGTVEEEKGTAWETEEQLQGLQRAAAERGIPKEVKALGRKLVSREKLKVPVGNIDFGSIPESYLPTFFSLIGATGLSEMINFGFLHLENDLDELAFLSEIRHAILRVNAPHSSSR